MPRPIWNGVISFGLLNIPVTLHSAERRVDLHFRMIDSRNNKPVRYERVNSETGEEVPWADIVQAFEFEKGNYVVLSEEEISKAQPKGKESIELMTFVDGSEMDATYYEKTYYLLTGKKADKGYVLLREILRKMGRVGIGHVIIRTRRYLCAVMPIGDMLVLELLRFAQEVVKRDDFELPDDDLEKHRIADREMKMAMQVIDSMTAPWNPADYVDDYRERLVEIIEQRVSSRRGLIRGPDEAEASSEDATTNVVDFRSLLEKSLKSGRRQPKADAVPEPKPEKAKPKAKASKAKSADGRDPKTDSKAGGSKAKARKRKTST